MLIFILARSHAAENRSSACWILCWEDASSIKWSAKSKRFIDPAAPNCHTLLNSDVTVYLIHVVETMKRSVDGAHPCRSSTRTVNGRDLTFPTMARIFEQEYGDLTASNRRPSTPHSRNTLQRFSRGTRSHDFSRSTKHMWTSLACPNICQKFVGEWNLVCSAMVGTKTALGIIHLWFNYFAASFSRHLVT